MNVADLWVGANVGTTTLLENMIVRVFPISYNDATTLAMSCVVCCVM